MKRLLFAFLLCGVFESCFCQDVKGFVMQQYEEWFSSKDSVFEPRVYPHKIKYKIKDLTLGKSKTEFFNSIKAVDVVLDYPKQATVQMRFDCETLFIPVYYYTREPNESAVECCCEEDSIIDESFKHLNSDNDTIKWQYIVFFIYDSEGLSIDIRKEQKKWYLQNPATVRDKDGYVNVREERSVSSKVVGTIKEGDVIFYTPSAKSDWWMVWHNYEDYIGYVHKSRILTYENCPPEVQRKIEREMH